MVKTYQFTATFNGYRITALKNRHLELRLERSARLYQRVQRRHVVSGGCDSLDVPLLLQSCYFIALQLHYQWLMPNQNEVSSVTHMILHELNNNIIAFSSTSEFTRIACIYNGDEFTSHMYTHHVHHYSVDDNTILISTYHAQLFYLWKCTYVTVCITVKAHAAAFVVLSAGDFEVFRPSGATRCTDRGDVWREQFLRQPQPEPVCE